MTRPFAPRPLQFYLTAPGACPYLPDREERKVFAHLNVGQSAAYNDALTHAGFRRSQSIIYRPACEACEACMSARVPTSRFKPTRSQRRVIARNTDLSVDIRPSHATEEQYELLAAYLHTRHGGGGMSNMTFGDYALMVADTPTRTHIAEYRDETGALVAAALVDKLGDGFSLVYSFFDAEQERRSLGSYVILEHIARALREQIAYVYLGYWVEGSAKMAYKARFRPIEVLKRDGWALLEPPASVR